MHDSCKKHKDSISSLVANKVERRAARAFFLRDCVGATDIAENERARYDEEGSEPEVIK